MDLHQHLQSWHLHLSRHLIRHPRRVDRGKVTAAPAHFHSAGSVHVLRESLFPSLNMAFLGEEMRPPKRRENKLMESMIFSDPRDRCLPVTVKACDSFWNMRGLEYTCHKEQRKKWLYKVRHCALYLPIYPPVTLFSVRILPLRL